MGDLGYRSQGKGFVYPLSHLRNDPLYDRAVRRADAGKKVRLEPYRSFHEWILRVRIRFPGPRPLLRPYSLTSLAVRGVFARRTVPKRTSRREGGAMGDLRKATPALQQLKLLAMSRYFCQGAFWHYRPLGMIASTSGPWGIARKRRQAMKKVMLLVAMLAMVMMLATPAVAQDDKAAKQAQKAAKAEAKAAKAAQKGDKMKEMPKTGGVPINASLLGLGAGALLVGGGLLVRKVTR